MMIQKKLIQAIKPLLKMDSTKNNNELNDSDSDEEEKAYEVNLVKYF